MDIRQVLQGCCGTTMEQSDKQAVIDYVEGLQAQVKMLQDENVKLHGYWNEAEQRLSLQLRATR